MKNCILPICLAAAVVTMPSFVLAQDDVETLYNEHCVACHGPEVYTREDRKVTSPPALQQQVQRCETALGLRWFDEDVSAMSAFLDEHYYHFKP